MDEARRRDGLQFDYFWMDAGWWGRESDHGWTVFDRETFPNGPDRIIERAHELDMRFGLWLNAGACTATPENRQDWERVIATNLTERGMQGLKFDGARPHCYNADHAARKIHLPGKYAVEAVQDANIERYARARELCLDLWQFLYWGHDSPWWLLHGSVSFDTGLHIEMSTPGSFPNLHERDSVMVSMDQAQQYRHDVPPMGWYALGLWTTTGWTPWGLERWREYLIMDLCRGQGFLHMWSDMRQFSEDDLAWLLGISDMYRRHAACFHNARPMVGFPWRCEPYGYRCSDGQRAFVVVYNPTWTDQRVEMVLGDELGLTDAVPRAAFRHFPDPVRWTDGPQTEWAHGDLVSCYLRQFEMALVEFAPVDMGPGRDGAWQEASMPTAPPSPAACEVPLEFEKVETSVTHVRWKIPPCDVPAMLALIFETTKDGREWVPDFGAPHPIGAPFVLSTFTMLPSGRIGEREVDQASVRTTPAYRATNWIVLKVPVEPSSDAREVDLLLAETQPWDVDVRRRAHLVPT